VKLLGKEVSSPLLKDTAIYMFGSGIQRAIGLILIPLYVHVLSPSEIGFMEIGNNISSIFIILFTFCLHQAVFLEYYHFEEDKRISLLQQASAGYIIFSLPLFVTGLVVMYFWSKEISGASLSVISITSITFFSYFTFFQTIFLQNLRLTQQSLKSTIFSTATGLLTAFTNIILVYYLKFGIEGVFVGNLIAMGLSIAYILFDFRQYLHFRIITPEMIRLIKIGSPFIISGLSYWLYTGANNQILIRTLGSDQLGLFSVAMKFVVVFTPLLITPLMNAYTPHLFKKFSKGTYYYPYQLLIVAGMLFFILLGFIMQYVAGFIIREKIYQESLQLIPLLMPGIGFILVVNICVIPLLYFKKSKRLILNVVFGGISSMFFCYILSIRYGLQGAAIAFVIGNGVWAAFTLFQMHRVIKKQQSLS
jgi:O-antigen/teichoic acid export membrane protein